MEILPGAQWQLNGSPIWPNFELVSDVVLVDVLVTCKNKDPIENENARVVTRFSPIIIIWELSIAMETGVLIRYGPKPHEAHSTAPMLLQLKFDCDQPTGSGDILV